MTQEQARNTSLRAILSKDLTDLEIMEGQKIGEFRFDLARDYLVVSSELLMEQLLMQSTSNFKVRTI